MDAGPCMLQALNILENFDLKSMGYNSSRYIHTLYQTMSLAFADRDFYYGDPYFSPEEPMKGLLSKEYAKERAKLIQPEKEMIRKLGRAILIPLKAKQILIMQLLTGNGFCYTTTSSVDENYLDRLTRGTTSIEAADKEGWVVSVTPSGGWVPACIAGHTGVGMSQRMQSFVLDPSIESIQCGRTGQTSKSYTYANTCNERWKTVFSICSAGRRYTGPEPSTILFEYG